MTIEERAKAYDESLKRAKEVYNRGYYKTGDIETIFPELAESNDEKIRKALIELVKFSKKSCFELLKDQSFNIVSMDAMLAWLEKQVEQKPTDNVEPKFHIGDWVVNKSGFAQQVLDFRCGIYTCTYSSFTTDCESNYHLWTIKDAKPGDVIAWDDSKCIAIFKSIYDEDSFNSYGFVGHCTGTFETFESRQSYHEIEGAHPATKEQYDTLMQAIAKAGYEFDFEKKELLKIEK